MDKGQRHLYLVYSVGVPGIGKSFVIHKLKDYSQSLPDVAVRVCTSDLARSTTLDVYYKANNINLEDLTQEDIYQIEVLNGPVTRAAILADIQVKIKELWESGAQHNIFIMDKNHSANDVISTVNEASDLHFKDCPIHRCVLTPEIFESRPEEQKYYPFNFDILLIGLIRNLLRKEHMTMKYGPIHSLLSFIGSLQKQVKDSLQARFPLSTNTYIPVHYYGSEAVEAGKHDPIKLAVYDQLQVLVDDLVNEKKTISSSADEVVKLVDQLASMSQYAAIDEDYVRDLHKRITESKTS